MKTRRTKNELLDKPNLDMNVARKKEGSLIYKQLDDHSEDEVPDVNIKDYDDKITRLDTMMSCV